MTPLALSLIWLFPQLPTDVAATVHIRAGDKAVGTGWVVDRERKLIVTARHVVADRKRVDVFFFDRRHERDHYLSQRADLTARGRLVEGTVIQKRDGSDLALIRVDSLPADVPALRLADREAVAGDPCRCVGHRQDVELMWNRSAGVVRQLGRLSEGYHWAGHRIGVGIEVLITQLPVDAGDSGAALLNAEGRVIGVVSAVSNRMPGTAIVVGLPELRSLLTQVEPTKSRWEEPAGVRSTVWVRPTATDGRFAGVLIDHDRRLVLTSADAVGPGPIVDVVAPIIEEKRIVAEAAAYGDLLGLRLGGRCVQGVVLARDVDRDLALIELDRLPDELREMAMADAVAAGDRITAMSHPISEELMWMASSGSVRSVGKVSLRNGSEVKATAAVLQLPHQGSSAGGPVVDTRGRLVGILSGREGPRNEVAYCPLPAELSRFLAGAKALTHPAAAKEWHDRGVFLRRRDRGAAAVRGWSFAVMVEGENEAMLVELAAERASAGDNSARSLLPKEPATAVMAARTAEVLRRLKDTDAATRKVEAALKIDPRCAEAFVVRARLRSGQPAMDDVAEALAINVDHVDAYRVRATLHNLTKEGLLAAAADWSRVIELEPANVDAWRARAVVHQSLGEFKKAARDRQAVTELRPLEAASWWRLAEAEANAGQEAAAKRAMFAGWRVRKQ